ncbi:16S rRNA (cytosine967-C5)-methyltransferase [Pedobacter sp. UYP30]|uniref:RsmB/NOP family class I SAM-dependent RNA methyltransferase n=1 Tax=Pedobacter sp. UYP30 TaxID=1756400 RepID=UPI0033952A23
MKLEHQLRAFDQILAAYDGLMPLHRFLPVYYRKNKQMGSSDRRWATRYIYSFFRLGKSLRYLAVHERLAVADFLCHCDLSLVVEGNLPALIDKCSLPLDEKLAIIASQYADFDLSDVFPFNAKLSESLAANAFYSSFFVQPKLFIRVRESDKTGVLNRLETGEIAFEQITSTTLAFLNGTKLDHVLEAGTYQVQDFSSQQTGLYFKPVKHDKWWDCCAASGGKSLLLHSLEQEIDLLVSDLRPQVLENLETRFRLAGLKKYQRKELDLLVNNAQILHHYQFDGIIVDAPCTGSGTWGRTPEMLSFFDENKIAQYAKIQKSILTNVSKYLKPGKPLIYITCSAFAEENEQIVTYCVNNLSLKLERMELMKGYEQAADTMFVARFIGEEQ